uniref:Diguanylate cyclase DosC n=1 Tax=mine drainage metagenome TaxID=410659 RepID=E6PPQ3_9ZZZZ
MFTAAKKLQTPTTRSRLRLLTQGLLLVLPALLVMVWGLWAERNQYHQIQGRVVLEARREASSDANAIANRLQTRFTELQFAAAALHGPDADPASPDPKAAQSLRRLMAWHPGLYVVNIEAPDGTVLWSTEPHRQAPGLTEQALTPLASNPNFLLGPSRAIARASARVLTMKYRVQDAQGRTRYVVSAPYRLDRLLGLSQSRIPWTLAMLDVRSHRVLGVWKQGQVDFGPKTVASAAVQVAVPGYPLIVEASWPSGLVRQRYWQTALMRWIFEAGTILLLGLVALSVRRQIRQRGLDAKRQRQLAEFNAMLAQVNQAIARADDESSLLTTLCQMTVKLANLKLAWIGRPGDTPSVEVLAAASNAQGILGGLAVAGRPGVTEGQGAIGRAWRDGQSVRLPIVASTRSPDPHAERANPFDVRSMVVLPIRRSGRMWGVFAMYSGRAELFGSIAESLLDRLASDVSGGLDRMDLAERARHAALLREALLDNAVAGIALTRGRRIVDANPRFATLLGYASKAALIGQATGILYPDDSEFARVKSLYPDLYATGSVQLTSVRLRCRDGGVITCDLSGGIVQDMQHALAVWTVVDVTARDRLQAQVEHQALHDTLTGLPNRRALEAHLPKAVARAHRNGTAMAVGMIDLDDFKPVNDTWGHEAGDALLQELAKRLRAELRESDWLARLGGDEFIVVIEDLDAYQTTAQLARIADRLHHAVETPVTVAPGQTATVGLSMGLALFPTDAEEGDALMRLADAAMYQAKMHKHDGTSWWRLGTVSSAAPERETGFDAYGRDAAALLDKARAHFAEVAEHFVDTFYADLDREPHSRDILANLSTPEMAALKQRQAGHLRLLLAPETTLVDVQQAAQHLGRSHALVGVNSALLVHSLALYRRLLTEHLNQALLPARERYRILLVAERRLQDDIQTQLQVGDATIGSYLDVLATPLPRHGQLLADVRPLELAVLAKLPGVLGALLMRPNTLGIFTVEDCAGSQCEGIAATLRATDSQVVIHDPADPRSSSVIAQAWRRGEIVGLASYTRDPRHAFWRESARALGLRSVLAIPLNDATGHVVAVLALYGAYPGQFESAVMRQVARGIQQRWEQIGLRCSAPAAVVTQERAEILRQQLFAGGLRMFMQPIVDLRSGHLIKVEALARLELADGPMIAPGVFLPLLGEAELSRLFRMGLDKALGHLAQWDAQGLRIGVSVNMPPSVLRDSECVLWVEDILRLHGIASDRLTLELLETQVLDSGAQDTALSQLKRLGCELAMDDLGSGYSSLLRLTSVPFDTIKIDQGLLMRIRDNPLETLGLMVTIIQMGRDLRRDVVVEGLEDAGMIEAAMLLGAQYGQGFGLAKPMPPDQIVAWRASLQGPANPLKIRTFLGALAYSWFQMRGDAYGQSLTPYPVADFLHARGLQTSPAAQWHAQVHANPGDLDTARKLLDWLVAQVQREGQHAGA